VDWKRGEIISRKKEKTQMSLVVHNPTSGPVAEKETLAERLDTLENGVLGVINNGKYHSDTVLNKIAERLKSLYTLKNVIVVKKDSASRAVKEDIAKRLAGECDFVIAGIGDWGSCSSGSLLDGIVMEKLGLPAAVICTEPFVSSGRAMAVSQGIPDYPFAVIPHPIAATEVEKLQVWADQAIDQIVSILTKGRAGSDVRQ
jgi:hypothetical protein